MMSKYAEEKYGNIWRKPEKVLDKQKEVEEKE